MPNICSRRFTVVPLFGVDFQSSSLSVAGGSSAELLTAATNHEVIASTSSRQRSIRTADFR
jgi:hypothetical protein